MKTDFMVIENNTTTTKTVVTIIMINASKTLHIRNNNNYKIIIWITIRLGGRGVKRLCHRALVLLKQ